MLLTGGKNTRTKASRYSRDQGWVEDLADFSIGRASCGCAVLEKDNEKVIMNEAMNHD